VRFGARIGLAVAVSVTLAWLAREGVHRLLTGDDKLTILVHLGVIGVVGLGSYLLLARLVRLQEVTEVTDLLTRRLTGRSAGSS
jgi:hypothetical protein